jgi:hypothetical protein
MVHHLNVFSVKKNLNYENPKCVTTSVMEYQRFTQR